MSLCHFIGVLYPDTSGHRPYLNGKQISNRVSAPPTPWRTDSYLHLVELSTIARPGDPTRGEQEPEGTLYTEQAGAWTLIACWDRSADSRGGCCATFAAQTADIAEALASIREHYARTLARIEAHVGKPIEAWPRVALSDAYPQAPLSKARRACCPTCKGSGVAP